MVKRKIWDIPLGMLFVLCPNIGYIGLVYFLTLTDVGWQIIEGNKQLGTFADIVFFILGCSVVSVIQFAYVIPMYLRFKKKGRANLSRGVAIAAIVTLVLGGLWIQGWVGLTY